MSPPHGRPKAGSLPLGDSAKREGAHTFPPHGRPKAGSLPLKRCCLAAGIVILAGAWLLAWAGYGMTGHMVAHMAAVAVAAPLLAVGLAGSRSDPATRWPSLVTPLTMSLVEMIVVWGWHLPALRAAVAASPGVLALEQALFVTAGLLLWSACLGTLDAAGSTRRAAGVAAMLLTTMHMTLLGVLVTLAPRTLFGTSGFTCLGVSVDPLVDQQIGGVVMLFVGGASYLAGGLFLLSRLLHPGPAPAWRVEDAGVRP